MRYFVFFGGRTLHRNSIPLQTSLRLFEAVVAKAEGPLPAAYPAGFRIWGWDAGDLRDK
jgi:hypothetical protein